MFKGDFGSLVGLGDQLLMLGPPVVVGRGPLKATANVVAVSASKAVSVVVFHIILVGSLVSRCSELRFLKSCAQHLHRPALDVYASPFIVNKASQKLHPGNQRCKS